MGIIYSIFIINNYWFWHQLFFMIVIGHHDQQMLLLLLGSATVYKKCFVNSFTVNSYRYMAGSISSKATGIFIAVSCVLTQRKPYSFIAICCVVLTIQMDGW